MATLTQNAVALGSPGASLNVQAAPDVKTLVRAGGRATDVVRVEGSVDGTTWAEVFTFLGPSGVQVIDQSLQFVRTAGASGTQGSLYCNWTFEDSVEEVSTVNQALNLNSAGGAGTALDLNPLNVAAFKTFQYGGGASTDVLAIQVSSDNTNWVSLGAIFGASGILELFFSARYVRSFYNSGVAGSAALTMQATENVIGGGSATSLEADGDGYIPVTTPSGGFILAPSPATGPAGTSGIDAALGGQQGGAATTDAAGDGGSIVLEPGGGGAASATQPGGDGGDVVNDGGLGGNASAAQPAGDGGDVLWFGGGGGSGTATQPAGDGGSIVMLGGPGGLNAGGGGGDGGDASLTAGDATGNGDGGNASLRAGRRSGSGVDGDVTLDAGNNGGAVVLSNTSRLVTAPGSQVLSAVGNTISPAATLVKLSNSSGGALTLTSTPTVADGVTEGQRLRLVGTAADPVVVQREAALAGSNVFLGAASRSIGLWGHLELQWVSGRWVEISFLAAAT
jgi:hypothetical protein